MQLDFQPCDIKTAYLFALYRFQMMTIYFEVSVIKSLYTHISKKNIGKKFSEKSILFLHFFLSENPRLMLPLWIDTVADIKMYYLDLL